MSQGHAHNPDRHPERSASVYDAPHDQTSIRSAGTAPDSYASADRRQGVCFDPARERGSYDAWEGHLAA